VIFIVFGICPVFVYLAVRMFFNRNRPEGVPAAEQFTELRNAI